MKTSDITDGVGVFTVGQRLRLTGSRSQSHKGHLVWVVTKKTDSVDDRIVITLYCLVCEGPIQGHWLYKDSFEIVGGLEERLKAL